VTGALLRIVSFFLSANGGGDAWARLALTAEWLRHPVFKVAFGPYPPGHFWLIGLFTFVFQDVVFAGRFLSLVLGIGTLYLVWRLARNLYGEPAGVAALAVFVFYTLHIGYSTTSSAEAVYLFFLLAGLMFFFGYYRGVTRRLGPLAMAGLSLTIAESIRLEAWAIFFGLEVILAIFEYQDAPRPAWFSRWLKPVLTLALTGGAWPILSMVYSAILFHDPMRSLSQHNTLIAGWFKAHPVLLVYQLALSPGVLLVSLSPLAMSAALYGLWKSWSSRMGAAFAGLTLLFAALQNYEIITGKLLAMARYTMTLGAMLAVLAGFGWSCLSVKLPERCWRLATTLGIAFLAANVMIVLFVSEHPSRFSDKVASVSPRLRYPSHVQGVANYLRKHITPNDAVMIDDYNEESNVVAVAAGFPLEPGKRAFMANKNYDITAEQYVTSEKPRFVVYSDQGTLRHWFALPSGCAMVQIEGIDYRCMFTNPIYRIYERTDIVKN
jgi:4-amino-4-deoxy-L-arabinose transferase-like glycosyltransferase